MMDCSVAVGSLSGLFFVSTSIKPSPSLSGFRSGRLVALVQTARRPAAKRSLAAGDKRCIDLGSCDISTMYYGAFLMFNIREWRYRVLP